MNKLRRLILTTALMIWLPPCTSDREFGLENGYVWWSVRWRETPGFLSLTIFDEPPIEAGVGG